MKIKYLLIAGALASGVVNAADKEGSSVVTEQGVVKIEWQNPKEFRDVKAVGEIQSRFENRTFKQLTKALNKVAVKSLKDNQKIEMIVTDLDLAGDVRPTFGATNNDIRLVKNLYPPRIAFDYKVLEGDKVIMVGTEKLKDMSFLDRGLHANQGAFKYESALLESWLKKTVMPMLK